MLYACASCVETFVLLPRPTRRERRDLQLNRDPEALVAGVRTAERDARHRRDGDGSRLRRQLLPVGPRDHCAAGVRADDKSFGRIARVTRQSNL